MYSNCECVPICNKTLVAISILTEFYLLRTNCHVYTLMMEGTGSGDNQYSFTTLHGDTLWKTIFNDLSSLRMPIHVTGMYLTCVGEQLSHPVIGYTEWRKHVMIWQFFMVLYLISVYSLVWLEKVKKRRPPHMPRLSVLVGRGRGPRT